VTRFGIDLERLEALTVELRGCERRLAEARAEIDVAVRDVHAEWRGAAAAAHADAHRQWSAGEAEMREALAALQQIAATAVGNYAAAASAGARMWAG
jgi:uncharacterized protein YukE